MSSIFDPVPGTKVYEQNTIVGIRTLCALGYFTGGFLHIPAIKTIARSDLQNFWKFFTIVSVASNGMECMSRGAKQFQKAIEVYDGTEENESKKETEEEKKAEFHVNSDFLHEVKEDT